MLERDPYLNIQRYLSADDIKMIISHPDVKVVSFDIFDTLLVRPSLAPTDIFYLLDLRFPESPKKFSELRLNAEERLGIPNATLSEIWSFIMKSEQINPELAETMMQAEVALESQLLTVRKDVREIYQFAREQGKRVIAVSDMYIPADILGEILYEKGYSDIEQIYVSCEHKKRKDSGELFKFVLSEENVTDPSQMVHMGDNEQSDYRIPLNQGITAIYYPSVWNIMLAETSWWKKAVQHPRISEDPFTRMLYSFTFLHAYNMGYRPDANNCFETLADFTRLYLSPLLVSTALDLLNNEDIQSGYREIYFAARDGYLPLMAYQRLAEGMDVIPAKYLHVSRSALSYVQYKDFFDLFEHFEPATSYYLRDFLEYFLIERTLREKICHGLSKTELDCDLSDDPLLGRKLLLRFKDELNGYFAKQKHLAERYYADLFRGSGKRQLVFDCGYSGSVSSGLMSACAGMMVDKYYLWQTEKNVKRDKKNGTKTFCRFQSNIPYGINLIIEECFSPAQGTHIGFAGKGNDISPVQEEFVCSEYLRKDLELVRQTAQEYAARFSTMFCGYLNAFVVGQDDVFGEIGQFAFLRSPTAELRFFENFKFPDRYTREENESLSFKIQNFFDKSLCYPTSISGTGFLLEENYAQIPERVLSPKAKAFRLGIHAHLHNKHLFPELYGHLKDFPVPFDLYVTVTEEKFIGVLEKVFQKTGLQKLNRLKILLVENRGRDVAPWLVNTAQFQSEYDLFCHLHGKESPQNGKVVGTGWRDHLWINLLHRQAVVDSLNLFAKDDALGVIFPEPYFHISDIFNYGRLNLLGTMGEEETVLKLLRQMGLNDHVERHTIIYSIGTMMWYRPAALKPLFDLELQTEDFPEEPIGVGGTIAHAIERLPPLVAHGIGYRSVFFTEFPSVHHTWLERQTELFESPDGTAAVSGQQLSIYGNANIGLKGTLKIFIHKHIPFLFRNCAEIQYENPIGVRGALAIYLSKLVRRLLHV